MEKLEKNYNVIYINNRKNEVYYGIIRSKKKY